MIRELWLQRRKIVVSATMFVADDECLIRGQFVEDMRYQLERCRRKSCTLAAELTGNAVELFGEQSNTSQSQEFCLSLFKCAV